MQAPCLWDEDRWNITGKPILFPQTFLHAFCQAWRHTGGRKRQDLERNHHRCWSWRGGVSLREVMVGFGSSPCLWFLHVLLWPAKFDVQSLFAGGTSSCVFWDRGMVLSPSKFKRMNTWWRMTQSLWMSTPLCAMAMLLLRRAMTLRFQYPGASVLPVVKSLAKHRCHSFMVSILRFVRIRRDPFRLVPQGVFRILEMTLRQIKYIDEGRLEKIGPEQVEWEKMR